MIDDIQNIKRGKKELRQFGVIIGIILLLVSGLLFYLNKGFEVLLILGSSLVVTGVVVPKLLKPIYVSWMVFATVMGWIMTRVILGLLFYAVLTPIGVIARVFGKRFLASGLDESKESNWNFRDTKQPQKQDYEKQF